MQFFFKRKPRNPVVKMIVPGRRALGETWSEVAVLPRDDGGFDLETRPAEHVPATGQPIVIPAMANLSTEEVNFIMEGALKAADYESRKPRRRPVTDKEVQEWAQKLWDDYFAQKLAYFQGVSQFGPAGKTQRERPALRNWNTHNGRVVD